MPLRTFFAAIRGNQNVEHSLTPVNNIMCDLDTAFDNILENKTIRDLVVEEQQRKAPAPAANVKHLNSHRDV